jgi:DNA-binding response OmpR family regulator
MRTRVLIFDDDPMIRHMLWAVCDRRGYEVFTFPDPILCPLHAKYRCPCKPETTCSDVIISDLDMPNVKGLDFVKTLLGKGCRCSNIALMSGAWSARDRARAAELGCRLLTKPFHISEVMEWLDAVDSGLAPDRQLQDWQTFRSTAGEETQDGD